MNAPLPDAEQLISDIQLRLSELLQQRQIDDPAMVGIHTGGVWLADRLAATFTDAPIGSLNISFYRDDFTRVGLHPQVKPSELPFSVEDRHIILVDDVIMSGRTIRAALNELFDYGRPASVILVALIALGQRELPICADIIGQSLTQDENMRIKLLGPSPLKLIWKSLGSA